jgi:hypothetical protein
VEELTAVKVGAGLTIWPTVPELPLKLPSAFEYTALTVCGEPLTARVAIAPLLTEALAPEPDSCTAAPKGTPSIENWTEPVGVAAPVVSVTVAVNVTDCPKVDGLAEEVTVTEVEQIGVADAVFDETLSRPSESTVVTK